MKCLLLLLFLCLAGAVHAENITTPGSTDPRVRTVAYNERDVVKIVGHYGFQTLIQFANDERIENISIGDSLAWQVVPNERGNLLFVKPIEKNADTNLTVVTAMPGRRVGRNRQRIYNFSLIANQSMKHADPSMTWTVRFHYPEDDQARLLRGQALDRLGSEALISAGSSEPTDWNFDYSFTGHREQVPKRIFDDGQFTYFEFDDLTDTPAIFLVDAERNESLVNYQVDGRYVVVHRVARQFTLRNGNSVTCIFNDAYPSAHELDINSPRDRHNADVSGDSSSGA